MKRPPPTLFAAWSMLVALALVLPWPSIGVCNPAVGRHRIQPIQQWGRTARKPVSPVASRGARATSPARSTHFWPDGVAHFTDRQVSAIRAYHRRPSTSSLTRLKRAFSSSKREHKLGDLLRKNFKPDEFDSAFKKLIRVDGPLNVTVGAHRRIDGDYIAGTYAGVIGWDGDKHGAVGMPGGFSYVSSRGKPVLATFGIFDQPKSFRWYNRRGYLPSLVTDFHRQGCRVSIENFADKVRYQDSEFVVLYSRVTVRNRSKRVVSLDPAASADLVRLTPAVAQVAPGQTRRHEYAVVLSRLSGKDAFPDAQELKQLGSFDEHFSSMSRFWRGRLKETASIRTPDRELNNAFKAGFIYTNIIKQGSTLRVGENGYHRVWDHDAIGIISGLLSAGYLKEGRRLLKDLPKKTEFPDATYKYPWPWALYLHKTGDLSFVRSNWKAISKAAHKIGEDRSGRGGIMKQTRAIDSSGHWMVDNWSAMLGLKAYRYMSEKLGYSKEASWATQQYDQLKEAVNGTLSDLATKKGIPYIPASATEANSKNLSGQPGNANWASHLLFGRLWDSYLFDGDPNGVKPTRLDTTYDHGFKELKRAGLPAGTFGGFPGFSSAYNAGYGSAALAGDRHRSVGIDAYRFLISKAQSGPYSWWENICAPRESPWKGSHPSGGGGSCPHMWGQSTAGKVLLDSIVSERYDGGLIVGRGVPDSWLASGKPVSVARFPIQNKGRVSVQIKALSPTTVQLKLTGDRPAGPVSFNLPLFQDNILSASSGTIDAARGVVSLPAGTRETIVSVRRPPTANTMQSWPGR